jgi:cardiolipin synthase
MPRSPTTPAPDGDPFDFLRAKPRATLPVNPTVAAVPTASHPQLHPANARWLATGAVAYRRMLALIDAAHTSIRCETYIWGDDRVGTRFRAALIRAAARGVRVQVLVDGAGSSALPADYWRALHAAGGTARVFNPLTFRHFSIRDHRKLLLIDDHTAITGGFNIAVDYDGDGITAGWRDLGIELNHAPALRQLAHSFDAMFTAHTLHPWLLRSLPRRKNGSPRHPPAAGPVLFSGPHLVRNEFSRQLLKLLKHARHVRIASAYFAPSFRLRRALRAVARRGGTVELLLAGQTDVPLAQLAARSLYGPLLKAGVRIWEYQPQILHAKLVLVDHSVFVGSANLDARSLAINYELTVHLSDPTLAAEAAVAFAADLKQSRVITYPEWEKTRTWLTRLRGAWARFLMTKVDPWLARRQMRDLS